MSLLPSQRNISLLPSLDEIKNAEETISQLCGEQVLQRFEQNGGVLLRKSFNNRDLQFSLFANVEFSDCDFTEVAATGVSWPKNLFMGCCFDRADFEYADFSNCQILPLNKENIEQQTSISGAGFNGVVLRDALIDNIRTKGSSFAYSDFTGAKIVNTKFEGTFEGCIFNKTMFDNTSFKDCNIQYADFTGAQFVNTEIGLMNLPYVFGIKSAQLGNGLNITSETGIKISLKELNNLKEELTNFHASRFQYFACANLALFFCDFSKLKQYIQEALNLAWEKEDYRSLKYVCKLIRVTEDQTGAFGKTTLRKFYDLIGEKVALSGHEAVKIQYELHDGHIRGLLLKDQDDILQIHIQSTTPQVSKAGDYSNKLIVLIQQSCKVAGIEIQIVSAQFSFNSNSRHVFGIKIVSVNQAVYEGAPNKSPWDAPTTISVCCSVISMLFAGLSATQSLFTNQDVPEPAPSIQQIIVNNYYTLNTMIVPETYILKQHGIPVTGWSEGRVIIYQQNVPTNSLMMTKPKSYEG